MKALILLILLSLTPYFGDHETADQRFERMDTTTSAIDAATLQATCSGVWKKADWCRAVWPEEKRTELAALLVTTADHETHLARHVGEGQCRPFECDHGLARHYWQPHSSPLVPRELWDDMVGIEFVPTTNAAYGASLVLGEGKRRCGSVEGAIAFYALSACRWKGTAERMRTYERVLARLQAG